MRDRGMWPLSLVVVSAVLAMAVVRCVPPAPTPPVPPVADAGTDVAEPDAPECSTPATCMCAKLASLGCEEGLRAECVPTLEHVIATRLTFIDEACIMAARSKAEARGCAGIRCP